MTVELDMTDGVGSRLRTLDTLIHNELSGAIRDAEARAREMLATTDEPFGWRFIDGPFPEPICTAAVFVLPGGDAPPEHRHPNSVQHMRVLSGSARVVLRFGGGCKTRAIGPAEPWLVIGQDVSHAFELSPTDDLVVLSFHTVPESELLEVSAEGERTYEGEPGGGGEA